VRAVFGLGNPGSRYAGTRHNAGFQVVDLLRDRWRAAKVEAPESYRAWVARRGGVDVALIQPLTFMNLSGEALEAWRSRHGLEDEDLLVVVDDVYLPVGTLRLRPRGSSGGHRGLESIEQFLPGPGFSRLRVGVGAAASAEGLREHVLEGFADAAEKESFEASLGRAVLAVECWLDEGILAAMNQFNRSNGVEEKQP
jgi:PTH1 family peptidyl-tRNA hydrolase